MEREQLASKVTMLEDKVSSLEEEHKRINSKLNAIDSKSPSFELMVKIADALDISLDEFR